MDRRFRCRHCKKLRHEQNEAQRFCGDPACQNARKNGWRREKYASDPDYRDNQRDSTDAWLKSQGGAAVYHRRYRNRQKVQELVQVGEQREPVGSGANSDGANKESVVKPGRYVLFAEPLSEGANSDGVLVEISVLSDPYVEITNIDGLGGPRPVA